jgi:hypothetical protein
MLDMSCIALWLLIRATMFWAEDRLILVRFMSEVGIWFELKGSGWFRLTLWPSQSRNSCCHYRFSHLVSAIWLLPSKN